MRNQLPKNLLDNLPSELPEELVSTLVKNRHVRVERIVSTGHSSPTDFWYDQDEHEWVLLLKGEATLLFEDGRLVSMQTGDHVLIPAHEKHRVQWTQPDEATVWLAVFYKDQ